MSSNVGLYTHYYMQNSMLRMTNRPIIFTTADEV